MKILKLTPVNKPVVSGFFLSFGISMLGVICNKAVMLANNGYMPVYGQEITFGKWTAFEKAKLDFLADIFEYGLYVLSIGDILIFIGVLLYTITLGYYIRECIKQRRII